MLRNAGTAQIMLVVHEMDLNSNQLWQDSFGFKPLTGKKLRKLKDEVPQLGCCPEGQTLLVRQVPKKAQVLAVKQAEPADPLTQGSDSVRPAAGDSAAVSGVAVVEKGEDGDKPL